MTERVCTVCGAPARPPFRAPPAEQAPDLDGRPGEPTRSTLPRWLQTCGTCAAAAPDLAALPEGAAPIVRSEDYTAIRAPVPAALPFLRWAMLCPADERHAALLQSAWAADDAGHFSAARLRIAAADAWGEPEDDEAALRQIDVLRRAGDLARAGARASAMAARSTDETTARVLAFQQARIAQGDTGRHLISSALRPPARMSHVAHGRRAKSGFWGRLFGG